LREGSLVTLRARLSFCQIFKEVSTMTLIGCGVGLLAATTVLVGLIPFLGWINWFTTLPLAALSAAMTYVATQAHPSDQAARMTLAASLILIAITLVRLSIGGEFI
jgi:signal transduction histidine kinase